MPRCDGMPDGICPGNRNDNSVKGGEGDLMLCPSCDAERHKQFLASNQNISKDVIADGGKAAKSTKSTKSSNSKPASAAQSTITLVTTGTGAVQTAASVNISDATSQRDVLIKFSEILMYIQHFRDRSSVAKLQEVVLKFFTDAEIVNAKKLLIDTFPELSACEFATERRSSTGRLAKEAQVADIINMFDVVDRRNKLIDVKFAALAYDRLPRYGPEEINIAAVVDRQVRTDQYLSDISSKLDSFTTSQASSLNLEVITDSVNRMDTEMRSSTRCLQEQINQLTTICSKLVLQPAQRVQPAAAPAPASIDRSSNVIITGVDENRDSNIWKMKIISTLNVAAGRDVAISDAFRIGRYNAERKRPILVRLHSVWDQRLVVSGARKLAGVEELRGIFLCADEPAEVRRKKILSRLKTRAERASRIVSVSQDGNILSIDGVEVYCVSRGRLCEFTIDR